MGKHDVMALMAEMVKLSQSLPREVSNMEMESLFWSLKHVVEMKPENFVRQVNLICDTDWSPNSFQPALTSLFTHLAVQNSAKG